MDPFSLKDHKNSQYNNRPLRLSGSCCSLDQILFKLPGSGLDSFRPLNLPMPLLCCMCMFSRSGLNLFSFPGFGLDLFTLTESGLNFSRCQDEVENCSDCLKNCRDLVLTCSDYEDLI